MAILISQNTVFILKMIFILKLDPDSQTTILTPYLYLHSRHHESQLAPYHQQPPWNSPLRPSMSPVYPYSCPTLGPIVETIYELISENSLYSNFDCNDPIMSQNSTSYDSLVVVTFAKFWHDEIIIFYVDILNTRCVLHDLDYALIMICVTGLRACHCYLWSIHHEVMEVSIHCWTWDAKWVIWSYYLNAFFPFHIICRHCIFFSKHSQ